MFFPSGASGAKGSKGEGGFPGSPGGVGLPVRTFSFPRPQYFSWSRICFFLVPFDLH